MRYEILLDITGCRPVDKHENKSILYQAATYQAKPSEHVKAYKARSSIGICFLNVKYVIFNLHNISSKSDLW